jgi:hypothetical protein
MSKMVISAAEGEQYNYSFCVNSNCEATNFTLQEARDNPVTVNPDADFFFLFLFAFISVCITF